MLLSFVSFHCNVLNTNRAWDTVLQYTIIITNSNFFQVTDNFDDDVSIIDYQGTDEESDSFDVSLLLIEILNI